MIYGGDNLRISKKLTNLVKMASQTWLNVEKINKQIKLLVSFRKDQLYLIPFPRWLSNIFNLKKWVLKKFSILLKKIIVSKLYIPMNIMHKHRNKW